MALVNAARARYRTNEAKKEVPLTPLDYPLGLPYNDGCV
jgi:hypothetical protein